MPNLATCGRISHKSFLLRFLLNSPIGVAVVFVAYSALGAVIFDYLEGEEHRAMLMANHAAAMGVEAKRNELITWMQASFPFYTISQDFKEFPMTYDADKTGISFDNGRRLFKEKMDAYQLNVTRAIRFFAYDGDTSYSIEDRWSFASAFMFAMSVGSTIGYGHIAPVSDIGRGCLVLYALLAIPIFMWLVGQCAMSAKSMLSFVLYKLLCFPCRRNFVSENRATDANTKEPPQGIALLAFMLAIGTIFGFAFVYQTMEKWTYVKGIYFSYVNMFTIGFGDYYPGRDTRDGFDMKTSIVMSMAMSIVSMTMLGLSIDVAMRMYRSKGGA